MESKESKLESQLTDICLEFFDDLRINTPLRRESVELVDFASACVAHKNGVASVSV